MSLYLEAKTFLHGLLTVEDKLSMNFGLESRLPFLDNDLVDFSQKIPLDMKIDFSHYMPQFLNENESFQKHLLRTSSGKKILRDTLSTFMPMMDTQNKKQGFSAPDASWFKGESLDFVKKNLLAPSAKIFDICDKNVVQKIINEHMSCQSNHRLILWSFLYMEQFLKNHF